MKNITKISLIALLLFSLTNCSSTDEPLLSFLLNNRMLVIVKATYASDSPLDFTQINNNQIFQDAGDTLDTTNLESYSQLPFFIDIGEIRLSSKAFLQDLTIIQSPDDTEQFWDVLSTDRQVYCNKIYSSEIGNNSCLRTGGLVNFNELMNGHGAVYPSRDVGPATYLHAGVYVRALVTGHSRAEGLPLETKFDNNDLTNAANILGQVNFDPGSEEMRQYLAPQFFPLHHKVVWGQQAQMVVDNSSIPVVFEVRFNLKENLMVHGFTNGYEQNQTIVAFSDWRKPHNSEPDIGGNVLTRSRFFYPDFVSDLHISGGTESSRHYYAIYIENECYDGLGISQCSLEDQLPLAATPVRNGVNVIKNLSAGPYRLQCRYDAIYDGYPEQVLGEVIFQMGVGPSLPAQIACACGGSTSAGCN